MIKWIIGIGLLIKLWTWMLFVQEGEDEPEQPSCLYSPKPAYDQLEVYRWDYSSTPAYHQLEVYRWGYTPMPAYHQLEVYRWGYSSKPAYHKLVVYVLT